MFGDSEFWKMNEDLLPPAVQEDDLPTSKTPMTRLEAMTMLWKFNLASGREDLVGMIDALEIPRDVVEQMTMPELLDCFAVRVADLCKITGMTNPFEVDDEEDDD